ncbi:ATP-binding protein [Streptomyces sp. NBC_01615]|uniref:ATP-binding protein n=1 Tax=Streptomyces sp. NBC_01615 TaxID=2975898 RepID=UPI0038631DE4
MARSTAGHFEMDLVVAPLSVRIARVIVGAHIRLWGLDALLDRAGLAVSELLTNVWEHSRPTGGGQMKASRITLTRIPDGVTLCVHDADPTLPREMLAAFDDEHGRGLQIVKALSDQYGVCPSLDGGKDIWLTILGRVDA